MDIQLQELIDKIKKDGVATAEQKAAQILADAESKASQTEKNAQAKADELIKNAKAEIARLEKASEDALAQASRNMLISFKDSLLAELNKIVSAETNKAYSSDMLKKLVPETVKAWASKNDASELSVLLSEADLKELQSEFTSSLKSEIAKGLELKADKSLSKGFRIGVNNGEAFYDYSAQAVSELFAQYLNPRVAAIMKEAAKGTV